MTTTNDRPETCDVCGNDTTDPHTGPFGVCCPACWAKFHKDDGTKESDE